MGGNDKQNQLIYLFRKTWQYSSGNRDKIVWYWIMFIVANSITLFAQPFIWAKVINIITLQGISHANIRHILLLLFLTLIIDLAFWSLHGPARLIERANAFKARTNYRRYLLKGVMLLPMEWHVDHHSGDTIDKVEKGTSALHSFSEDSFEIIASLIQLIGSYLVLVYFSPPSAYIVLIMLLITVWITVRFDKLLVEQYKQLNHAENKISESIFDAISNITTVIILRVEKLIFDSIMHKVEKPYELFKRNNRLNELKWFLTNMCCTLMTICVLGIYFFQHIGSLQGVLVGSVYLLIEYLKKISDLFFRFTWMYGHILQGKSKVMNSEELAKDFIFENFINVSLPKNWHNVKINDLNFSYHSENGADLHLDNIAVSFNRGERIGLIDETGSGKTTFLKVLRDLYHPKTLELSVDEKIVKDGFTGINQAISLVPQNPELFATTILENITIGAEYSIETVKHFTDIVCFTDVVEKLPHKFGSSIKEKGVNLSGGEQQRLALARGLLASREKEIILLDEPTSSLDTAIEMDVYQNIFKEFNGKTIISTVHRLHLLPLFDKIYYFENGKIIGSGTFEDLLLTNLKFQTLWEKAQTASN